MTTGYPNFNSTTYNFLCFSCHNFHLFEIMIFVTFFIIFVTFSPKIVQFQVHTAVFLAARHIMRTTGDTHSRAASASMTSIGIKPARSPCRGITFNGMSTQPPCTTGQSKEERGSTMGSQALRTSHHIVPGVIRN